MSKRFEIQTTQTAPFKTLIETLKEILEDVTIQIINKKDENGELSNSSGIKILATNNTKDLLIYLKLDAKSFDKFECSQDHIDIGVNMGNFYKILKVMQNDDTLTLFQDEDDINHLKLIITSSKGTITNLKLNLIDVDIQKIKVPSKTRFNSIVTMSSSEFHNTCRYINTLSDTIEIKNVGNAIIFGCKGNFAEVEKCINGQNKEESTEIIQGKFDLKKLVIFTKCTSLCTEIQLKLSNDYPLFIRYQISDLGTISFCLSSMVSENEEDGLNDAMSNLNI